MRDTIATGAIKCGVCYNEIDDAASYEHAIETQSRICLACYIESDGVPYDYNCAKCDSVIDKDANSWLDSRDGAAYCSQWCFDSVGGILGGTAITQRVTP